MGGTISKKDWKLSEKVRAQDKLSRLENIEETARTFLRNPTPENKEKLRKAIFGGKKKLKEFDWNAWDKKFC